VDISSGTNHQLQKRTKTMSHTTSIRRAASIAGATGLIALSLAGPASAKPDPGTGSWAEQHCSANCYEGPASSGGSGSVVFRPTDDNAIEVLQLGAGILAGVALAGAGMSLASRRSHGHVAHPA
jgi:hypothetical protein